MYKKSLVSTIKTINIEFIVISLESMINLTVIFQYE